MGLIELVVPKCVHLGLGNAGVHAHLVMSQWNICLHGSSSLSPALFLYMEASPVYFDCTCLLVVVCLLVTVWRWCKECVCQTLPWDGTEHIWV